MCTIGTVFVVFCFGLGVVMLYRTLWVCVLIGLTACGELSGYTEEGAACELEDPDFQAATGPFKAVDLGSPLPDTGGQVLSVQGEIDDLAERHWYVVQTSDDKEADIAAGRNGYNFQVKLEQGALDYRFTVYRNDYIPSAAECQGGDGATEYSDFYVDTHHEGLEDPQACAGPGVPNRNVCEDMSATYYIEVFRLTEDEDCGVYQLSVANGEEVTLVERPADDS